ncbi:hypothetical protein CLOLEP_02407 [[Clostridium] leptum DSM 753]|uniref:Uncharacterized protein n=1 Tax=[Clostridium] leptum DSM 753 TaxID=428125 RepID=A7VV02_9FIRM|nr:hypothetical protein CLOLEP_02407 [[Clostridium] leptum DSM 753]
MLLKLTVTSRQKFTETVFNNNVLFLFFRKHNKRIIIYSNN